jgi:hypothetical protein
MGELNMVATNTDTTNPSGQMAGGLRLKIGIFLFGLSILMPIAGVPLAALFAESNATTASVTGGLLVVGGDHGTGLHRGYGQKWICLS